MTPRQMVAFGELYLNEGRTTARAPACAVGRDFGRTPDVVALELRSPGRLRMVDARPWRPHRRASPGASGGQDIFVFRDLGLVIVATSSTNIDDERRGLPA